MLFISNQYIEVFMEGEFEKNAKHLPLSVHWFVKSSLNNIPYTTHKNSKVTLN